MLQRKEVFNSLSHDFYYRYDWHDINQTITTYQKDGKDIATITGPETSGKLRTVTNLPLESVAKFKIWLKSPDYGSYDGGIEFYSVNGQGQETKHTNAPVHLEDIDPLLNGISGISSAGEAESFEKLVQNIKEAANPVKKIISVAEAFKNVEEATDAGINLQKIGGENKAEGPTSVTINKTKYKDTIFKMFPLPLSNEWPYGPTGTSDSNDAAKKWEGYRKKYPNSPQKQTKPFLDTVKIGIY